LRTGGEQTGTIHSARWITGGAEIFEGELFKIALSLFNELAFTVLNCGIEELKTNWRIEGLNP
jgi:hypothetical protein